MRRRGLITRWLVGGGGARLSPFVAAPASYLDPAKLRVGDQIGLAYVAGTYTYGGAAVTLGTPVYTVNGATVASSYVLQTGDTVAAAAVPASVGGTPVGTVYAEPTDVTDFSYTTSDFEYIVPAGAGDTTAPTLSSPTATANGATGINGTISTDEGNGTLYAVAYDSGHTAPISTQVKAGQDGAGAAIGTLSQSVTVSGAQAVSFTGISGAAAYKVAYAHEDAYGNLSAVSIISGTVALIPAAPVLTTPVGTAIRCLAATVGATTDKNTGTLYAVVTVASTQPTAPQIIAGQNAAGAAAICAGSVAVSSIGAKTIPVSSGMMPGAAYYAHLVHHDAYSQNSNVVSSAQFTMKVPVFLGYAKNNGTGANYLLDLTALLTDTGGTGGALQQGDVGFAVTGWTTSNSNENPGINTAGWTEILDDYRDATRDANTSVAWKAMGATPDTSVDVVASNNSVNGSAGAVSFWRYVDPTSPFDVSPVFSGGVGTTLVDGAAVTPVSAGAIILLLGGASGDNTPQVLAAPSNMTLSAQVAGAATNRGYKAIIARKTDWTSGAFDPNPCTSGEDSANDSWSSATLALKPY